MVESLSEVTRSLITSSRAFKAEGASSDSVLSRAPNVRLKKVEPNAAEHPTVQLLLPRAVRRANSVRYTAWHLCRDLAVWDLWSALHAAQHCASPTATSCLFVFLAGIGGAQLSLSRFYANRTQHRPHAV